MKTIKRVINSRLQKANRKPIKTIVLSTGIICEHFANGTIKIS
jgi:hypothetical protein